MYTERKTLREVHLEKEVEELKSENARLRDCILLQQKIIERVKK